MGFKRDGDGPSRGLKFHALIVYVNMQNAGLSLKTNPVHIGNLASDLKPAEILKFPIIIPKSRENSFNSLGH